MRGPGNLVPGPKKIELNRRPLTGLSALLLNGLARLLSIGIVCHRTLLLKAQTSEGLVADI